jgi:hypothetical protein
MLALLSMMPESYWDAFLLQRFPGKTLEELDGIDWGRLMRAQQVRHIDQVEEMRELYLKSKYKPTPDEWASVLRHDRLLRESADG